MKRIKIGKRWVGDGEPVFIIAEIGGNHQGKVDLAKQMIDIAIAAKADAVKFQKRSLHRILTKEGLNAPYNSYHSFGSTYGEHRKALELSRDDFFELKKYTKRKIILLASGWDEESVDFLDELGVPAFKVASADLSNWPLLEYTARKGKPVIISTGMSEMNEIEEALNIVNKYNDQVALMQCTSTYPCEFKDVNLKVIPILKEKFNVVVGYSGHERGIPIPVAAVAVGASIIEKHITIDRTMKGGDQAASLEPSGLTKLIRDIRHLEEAMGDGNKRLLEVEKPIRQKLAKSLVSRKAIVKNSLLKRSLLTTKGPGTGLSPKYMNDIIGKKTAKNIKKDEVIRKEDIVW